MESKLDVLVNAFYSVGDCRNVDEKVGCAAALFVGESEDGYEEVMSTFKTEAVESAEDILSSK